MTNVSDDAILDVIDDGSSDSSAWATTVDWSDDTATDNPDYSGDTISGDSDESDESESGDSDGSDDSWYTFYSNTSTEMYEDEVPLVTYQDTVREWASAAVWPGADVNRIQVERIRGGTFNRVIGLSLVGESDGSDQIDYILRIPRFAYLRTDRAVAGYSFVRTYTDIPVEEVVKFDVGTDNVLGNRFTLHKRLPGETLEHVMSLMTHEQFCRFARELGAIFRQMLQVKSTHAGDIGLEPGQTGPEDAPIHTVVPFGYLLRVGENRDFPERVNNFPWFDEVGDGPTRVYAAGPAAQSAEELITGLFNRQVELGDEVRDFDDYIRVTRELATGGWLDAMANCFTCELDTDSIKVNLEAGPDEPIISAMNEWDDAMITPIFYGCDPPEWLWERYPYDDGERTEEECRELKELFDEAAGPEYLRFAYAPAFDVARSLMLYAHFGVWASWAYDGSREAVEKWDALSEEDKVFRPSQN